MVTHLMRPIALRSIVRSIAVAATLLCTNLQTALAETTAGLIKQLQSVAQGDAGSATAAKAIKQLREAKDLTLVESLKAMKGATPIGRNWLMGLANSIHKKSSESEKAALSKFLADPSQDGEARYMVFQWLTANNNTRRLELLANMQMDTSPELRYLAIDEAIKVKPETEELSVLLESARHPDQVVSILGMLKEKGTIVDQAKQLGFLMDWRLIGPFDNVGTVNFNKEFPIENDWVKGTVQQEYDGKTAPVKWITETTKSPDGLVDLAALYSNEKGCIIYATTEFDSAKEQDAELRLGCINGNKIWVNGKLALSNEVYHSSSQIDQYAEPVKLKAGVNRILLKLCQNEQKEAWAQKFEFQLRISDSSGKAILAKGR